VATLKKYNLSGNEIGEVSINDDFLDITVSGQMVKDYIVALRANARQWSANTKTRSEVSHSTRKPHRQKGTGSARQGTLAAPQFRGGGIVFGPKPKFDQHVRINKKEKRLAIWSLLAEKIRENQVAVLEDVAFSDTLDAPKTKVIASFLKLRNLTGRRVLFVSEGTYHEVDTDGEKLRVSVASSKYEYFKRSVRNLPHVNFIQAANVNGYDLLVSREIVFSESALKEIQELLK
jgi:large subunit ribosomal protein L4